MKLIYDPDMTNIEKIPNCDNLARKKESESKIFRIEIRPPRYTIKQYVNCISEKYNLQTLMVQIN